MESYTNFGPQKGDGVAIFEKMHEDIRLYRHLYEAYLPWLLRDQKACLMVRDTGMKWDIKTSSHSSSWLKLEK